MDNGTPIGIIVDADPIGEWYEMKQYENASESVFLGYMAMLGGIEVRPGIYRITLL